MDDNNTGSVSSAHKGKLLIALIMVLFALPSFLLLAFSFSMPRIAGELQSSFSALEFLNTFETLALVAGSVIFGCLADRFGRKPLLLAAMGLMAAGMLLYPLSSSVTQFAASRSIASAGAGGMTVILTLLAAELASDSKRAFVIVLVGFGSFLGAIAGSFLAGVFLEGPDRDWRNLFYTGAGMSVTGLVLAWRLLPESQSWRQSVRIAGNKAVGTNVSLREICSRWPLLGAYFLMALVFYLLLRGVIPALADRPQEMIRLISWFTFGSISGSMLLLILLWKFPCSLVARYTLMLAAVVLLAGTVTPFITATQPVMLFSASLCINIGLAVMRALTIIELPVAVRGAGTGLLVLFMQSANPIASSSGSWLMDSTPGFVAIWVLMCLACLAGAWLLGKYFRQLIDLGG